MLSEFARIICTLFVDVRVMFQVANRNVVHGVVQGGDVDEFRCIFRTADDHPGRFRVNALFTPVLQMNRRRHVSVRNVVPVPGGSAKRRDIPGPCHVSIRAKCDQISLVIHPQFTERIDLLTSRSYWWK